MFALLYRPVNRRLTSRSIAELIILQISETVGAFSFKMNTNLYGPDRISAQTKVADLLARDSVLQKGEWHDEMLHRIPWDTTFTAFFKVRVKNCHIQKLQREHCCWFICPFVGFRVEIMKTFRSRRPRSKYQLTA